MNKIMKLRKAIGMSRAQLADACGISIKTLEAYELDARPIANASVTTAHRIASILGVNIETLTGLESHPIRITDIEQTDKSDDESHPSYIVTFDDGSTYEGVTTESGDGDEDYDCIARLRIGDVYADMNSFTKSIRF